MEEGGKAIPFFASHSYRMALMHLEDMVARDAIFVHGVSVRHFAFSCMIQSNYFRVGWAPVLTRDLYGVINNAFRADRNRRFLITPPENGGVNGTAWVIGRNVDDTTLSRILNLFDEFSFNPQIATLVSFGFYKESPHHTPEYYNNMRFAWTGEPYHSVMQMNRNPSAELGDGLFMTSIIDGHTLQRRFLGEFETVTEFAQSGAGVALNLLPSHEDIGGLFAVEKAVLDNLYWHDLMRGFDRNGGWGLVPDYLIGVLRGERHVALTWDDYIYTLNNHGLQEYIALFSRYPMR
jgi:hypothetical protein